jgi:hypothetical protein
MLLLVTPLIVGSRTPSGRSIESASVLEGAG